MNIKQLTAAGLTVLITGMTNLYASRPKGNRNNMEKLTLTKEWDKTFPKSDKVDHSKATFANRYGITLAADMYKPKDTTGKLPAIAVCGPFGAVKEQAAGLYAQEMAERGFLTIAFDPSFTGESGGTPRYMTSPDINTEDFSAAVDYLVTNPDVDSEKVGIIGICGWGGIAVNAAASDPRIKATLASTMYDMSRVNANGYFDAEDSAEARNALRKKLATQRTEDYINGTPKPGGGVPDVLPENAPKFLRDYHDYYKTERGYHPRSLNSNGGRNATSPIPWINFPLMSRAGEIENAVMILHGEKAHSFYFGSDTYKKLTVTPGKDNNKLFMVIPGASHTDLYDHKDIIPFASIEKFFNEYLGVNNSGE
ncbi:MAG: alpha/beta hydrolase [Bacteroidaceae bacterium]|nr:alpha/beta hydrolase [Bacteroidaceae bacterium]